MNLARNWISSELTMPDYEQVAGLEHFCSQDCSPEQVSQIYREAKKSVEDTQAWEPFGESMCTFTIVASPPRIPDPRPSLERQVRCAIAEEPVEAGYSHPAEAILAKAVINQPREVIEWLVHLLTEERNYGLVGDILACFGRAVEKSPPWWAYNIAENALLSSSVAVRDSAAQTLELWGTSAALRIPKKHDESVGWLRNYIEEVIELLETA